MLQPLRKPVPAGYQCLKNRKQAMIEPPKDKSPGCAMPQSCKEENNHPVCNRTDFPLPVSSKRKIQILPQPAGQ